jgi:hypothetical protein
MVIFTLLAILGVLMGYRWSVIGFSAASTILLICYGLIEASRVSPMHTLINVALGALALQVGYFATVLIRVFIANPTAGVNSPEEESPYQGKLPYKGPDTGNSKESALTKIRKSTT